MKKKIEVLIDRRKWYRGGNSQLRLLNGKQCCLGFACRVLGAKAKDILNEGLPGCLDIEMPGLNRPLLGGFRDTEFSEKAAIVNDNPNITDNAREKKLKALARASGFIFKFIN